VTGLATGWLGIAVIRQTRRATPGILKIENGRQNALVSHSRLSLKTRRLSLSGYATTASILRRTGDLFASKTFNNKGFFLKKLLTCHQPLDKFIVTKQ
jgi:hypothetical protein